MFDRFFNRHRRKGAVRTSGLTRVFSNEIMPWLRLLRVSKLFMSMGDPLAGACLASVMARAELSFWTLLDVCFCSIAITAFGMIQNDWCDLVPDRRLHPDRPLPMRQIPVLAAAIVALACVIVAICLAVISGQRVFLVAVMMIVVVSVYNFSIKKTLVGSSVGMGICRALNVMLGASLVGISPAVFVLMLAVGAYSGLLMTFRGGENPRLRQVPGKMVFVPSLVLLAGWLVTLPWTASRGSFLAPFICIVIAVATTLYEAQRIYGKAVGNDAMRRYVLLLFMGSIPFQAAWIVMPVTSSWLAVFICAAIFWLSSFYLTKVLRDNA
ncbi:MAG: UbiA family prenyltransferase [Victivallales bacterium]|nr:UbiA family prenyltransferase [Victivallales bacterium]